MNIFGMDISASEITSVCALGLSFYALRATRRHNQLSVTPHLNGCTNKAMTNEGFMFSYDISNNGIGPARIKSFVFFRDGKPFPKPTDGFTNYTDAMIRNLFGNKFKFIINYTYSFGTDTSLKAGDSRRIAEVLFPEIKAGEEEKVLNEIKGTRLVINYESFYGKEFVFDSDK